MYISLMINLIINFHLSHSSVTFIYFLKGGGQRGRTVQNKHINSSPTSFLIQILVSSQLLIEPVLQDHLQDHWHS